MPLAFRAPLHAAIIDLDGTLVDTLGDFTAALNAMLDVLDLPAVDAQTVGRFIGKGSEHLIQATLAHLGAPASLYPQGWDAYQSAYRELNGRWARVYPGVEEGLRALQAAGLRLACLTNKPGEFARALLRQKGLAHAFDCVFGGDAFERKKPDPLPLLKTCEALSTAPAATLVVGDSRNDAAAARAAHCPVVLVTYGYNHGEPVRAVDADAFVDSLAELGALLPRR
ncbi:phosphoglycolate phosphatase [Ramlibacter ginsenosidimutans]|uniref:Phosphoglycolate phosphatase n=1 Tax=Ramlibacter ginsenosidimutans TaxID=502333 RepID=A0A934WLG5_9BURK|nr:phosphoglycolate phosphatase [Ramlibacter ginsenosidimutans]MBK6005388.1 phosphoglycolate phosphatase [Ramlibacter ginsenosidimutans]